MPLKIIEPICRNSDQLDERRLKIYINEIPSNVEKRILFALNFIRYSNFKIIVGGEPDNEILGFVLK